MRVILHLIRGLPLAFLLLVVNGCEAIWPFSPVTTTPTNSSKELRVATIEHPLVYSQDGSGLEADLLNQFAQETGYHLTWLPLSSSAEVTEAVTTGKADIGAARLNLNLAFENELLAGPSYEEAPLSLICPRVKSSDDDGFSLFHKLFGVESQIPSTVEQVVAIKQDLAGGGAARFNEVYPGLDLVPVDQQQIKTLLKVISKNRTACALVDRNEAHFYLRLYPSLRVVRDLTPSISTGFLISKERPEIQRLLFSWFQAASRNHQIDNIRDRYFGHLNDLDSMDQLQFFRDVRVRLRELMPHFKRVSKEFGLPWHLVAAVAYQESHWNNSAESFTGVKGIMMLTQDTADHLGVEDRTDLAQSIWGGAKYIRQLLDRQPQFLPAREQLMLALASYNVGPAHLLDAQRLSVQLGRSPYSWRDLKKILPLLSQPEFYNSLEYGEARGQEPVDFGNRVLGFYELLSTSL